MSRYLNFNESGDCIGEAPFELVKGGYLIRGYNKESNEQMLLEDGYVKYTGHKPNSRLHFVNGQIVEDPDPVPPAPAPNTKFTRLKIRRAMRAMEMEDQLDGLLAANPTVAKDWNDAQIIDLNDPILKQALTANGITDEFVQAIIDKIYEMNPEELDPEF